MISELHSIMTLLSDGIRKNNKLHHIRGCATRTRFAHPRAERYVQLEICSH